MSYAKFFGMIGIALGIGLTAPTGQALAENCPVEAFSLRDEAGNTLGTLCPEGETGKYFSYGIEAIQTRFYVEMNNNPDATSKGYYVIYDPSQPQCAEGPATDHLGQQVASWGYLEHRREGDGESFAMRLTTCNGPFELVLMAIY